MNQYQCAKCPYFNHVFRKLVCHIGTTHASDANFQVTCGIDGCGRVYTKFGSFRIHLYKKHKEHMITENVEENDELPNEDLIDEGHHAAEIVGQEDRNATKSEPDLKKTVAQWKLLIQDKHLLPASVGSDVFEQVCEIVSTCQAKSIKKLEETLKRSGVDTESAAIKDALELAKRNELVTVHNEIKSGHKLATYLRERNALVDPEKFNLDVGFENEGADETAMYVPVEKVLKLFLTVPDVWENLNRDIQFKEGVLTDIYDGSHYKKMDCGQPTIYLLLYSDELEIVNPLGAKRGKQKIFAVYYSVLNIEPKYSSKLNTIHLAILAKEKHLTKYGFKAILKPLIRDLQRLSDNGLEVQVDGKTFSFYVKLFAMAGDNLSQHKIGEFNANFGAGRICRWCMATKEEISSRFEEHQFVLRTADVHAYHVKEVQADPTLSGTYGVKADCALSVLDYFSTTDFLSPDLMHDHLEGTLPFLLQHVLAQWIRNGNFSLDFINGRINDFPYGVTDRANKPVALTRDSLFGDTSIKGSASQKWCLFRLLPLLIGAAVDVKDELWILYHMLREIIQIIFSPEIPEEYVDYLEVKITSFLKEFHRIFPDVSLKPKAHFLIHYPRLIRHYGPLRRFWCMRFEANHAYFKRAAQVARNFVNITYSLANHYQKVQSYELSSLEFHKEPKCGNGRSVQWRAVQQEVKDGFTERFPHVKQEGNLWKVKSVEYDNCEYHEGSAHFLAWQEEDPVFIQVTDIFILTGTVYMAGNKLISIRKNSHIDAYELMEDGMTVFAAGEELDFHALDVYEWEGKPVIPLRHELLRRVVETE